MIFLVFVKFFCLIVIYWLLLFLIIFVLWLVVVINLKWCYFLICVLIMRDGFMVKGNGDSMSDEEKEIDIESDEVN